MLSSLHVQNYVLINSLEISFPEGLIIITGETGAGKSIMLGALSLVLGAKTDASMIATGADNCVVEAEFDMKADASVKEILDENEIDWNEGHIIIRRVVNSSGRSRSFVNDFPVPLPVLAELATKLIDIHSQHQTLLLSDRQFQLSILDHYAGNSQLLADCKESYAKLNYLRRELEEVMSSLTTLSTQKGYNEAQFKELDSAKLQDGEIEELDSEHKQLANAEEIKENLSQAELIFSPSESDQEDGHLPISVILKEAEKLLEKVGKYVPSAADLSARIASSRVELGDISDAVSALNANMDISNDRLNQVEERMSLLYDLMKKHSCTNIIELIAVREKYSEALFDSTSLQSRREELEKMVASESSKLNGIADRLHISREKASKGFADSIQTSIRSLELERSVFGVKLMPQELSSTGKDSLLFVFSATGSNPIDVAKCASGGEMSRIMLCLKAMMAKYTNMPTMIFDEIDTGVSGSVADKMGSKICDMGKDMQVFAITHLPQVAAKGQVHLLVTKTYDKSDGSACTTIKKLDSEERVNELARMLSGSVITAAAIANAKSLLSFD